MTSKTETAASLRADFMRRWFAIAISVGFAATVVNMGWVKNGVAPDHPELEQLARLFVALVATVLSWEGYLLSIQRKPLNDIWRYFLYILLVFLYLFLLLTSKFPYFWLALHALTFYIYAIWDLLTIFMYRDKFVLESQEYISTITAYYRGLVGNSTVDRGPVITIFWMIYFLVPYALSIYSKNYSTFVLAGLVLSGLVFYRIDKTYWRNLALLSPLSVISLSVIAILCVVVF